MKRKFLYVIMALCMLCISINASTVYTASGTCGTNLKWDLFYGTLTISGNGNMLNCPWRDYSSEIRRVVIESGVTSIRGSAFYYCENLKSVSISNTVTSIGAEAFKKCSALTSVNIPSSVKNIGNYAFYGCTSLPIEGYLRYADTYLVECTNKYITSCSIRNGTQFIANRAFYNCNNLKTVSIPNTLMSIGEEAFRCCSGLTSITIPNSVTSIGEMAFYYCTSLPVENNLRYADTYLVECVNKNIKSCSIKAGTRSIGYHAFYDCDSLTLINIPNSVTVIEAGALGGCSGLGVNISNLESWCKIDFHGTGGSGYEFNHKLLLNGEEIKDLNFPSSLTTIKPYTFAGCSSFASITIPNSVTSIGEMAFAYCINEA